MQIPVSPARACAIAATVSFVLSVAVFGAWFPVYSQLAHPVAVLGASGIPRAGLFNVLAYMVPGMLMAFASLALRERLSKPGWPVRLGLHALAFAGLGFALQGLWPLDSADLYARSSRLHGAAWTFWWVAFATGSTLLAWGRRDQPLAAGGAPILVCAVITLVAALVAPAFLPAGLAQRIAFASWFLAMLIATAWVSRSAA